MEEKYHKQANVYAKIVGIKLGLVLGYEKITCKGKEVK